MTVTSCSRTDSFTLTPELRQRCLDVLRGGLKSDEFWPSMHAAEALTLAGCGHEVRAALKDRVDAEKDDQRRCGLARELARAGDLSRVPVMLDILAKADTCAHTHAAESLFKVKQTGDGRLLRQAMAQTADLKRRLMAAAALARGGDQEALALVRKELAGPDREGRKIGAWILAQIGDAGDIPQLQRNLADEQDPLSRCYIVNALACLGDAAGKEAMLKNFDSPDGAVRAYSADFAGPARLTAASGKLVRQLDDPVLDARIRAAQALIVLSLR